MQQESKKRGWDVAKVRWHFVPSIKHCPTVHADFDFFSLVCPVDIVYEEIVGEYLTPQYMKGLLTRMMDEMGVRVSFESPLSLSILDLLFGFPSVLSILGTCHGHHRFIDICSGSLSFG